MATENKWVRFNIKRMAKATAFKLREGTPIVELHHFESMHNEFPVIGTDANHGQVSFTTLGQSALGSDSNAAGQLMMQMSITTGYVNVYEGDLYATKEDAETYIKTASRFIRTIKVEY